MTTSRYLRVATERGPRWAVDESSTWLLLHRPPWQDGAPWRRVPAGSLALLPPAEPTKVVCVGLNYRAHAEEMGKAIPAQPLLFLKPPSALLPPGGTVTLPPASAKVDHEGELACVIGRRISHASPAEATDALFGLTCADDVTARDIQKQEQRYTRAKGFDTFLPLGPAVVTGLSPDDLEVSLAIGGEIRQRGRSSDMIFPVADVLAFISSVMTLEPGDVVLTGTPPGVGPLRAGDEVAITIEGIGTLEHGVRAEAR